MDDHQAQPRYDGHFGSWIDDGALTLLIADAIILHHLGPDSDALRIDRSGDHTDVTITPLGRSTLLEAAAEAARGASADGQERSSPKDNWTDLLLPGLLCTPGGTESARWRDKMEHTYRRVLLDIAADTIPPLVAAAKGHTLTVNDGTITGRPTARPR